MKINNENGIIALETADILKKNSYRFEIDTQDIVMDFAKTMKTTTRNVTKAVNMFKKLTADCGQYIAPSVRVMGFRMYQNNVLIQSLNA